MVFFHYSDVIRVPKKNSFFLRTPKQKLVQKMLVIDIKKITLFSNRYFYPYLPLSHPFWPIPLPTRLREA